MPEKWPWIALGEVLSECQETPDPVDLATGEIRIIAKIGFDTGRIEFRPDAKTKTDMILIRPGDLVVSGINAAKGAIAIYPGTEKQPAAATIHYAAYTVNPQKAERSFMWWLLRSSRFRDILKETLPGGIKTELRAGRLLPVRIPLPPLGEQRRMVAVIERLAGKIGEARGLRGSSSLLAYTLGDTALSSILKANSTNSAWRHVPIAEVAAVNPQRPKVDLDEQMLVTFVPMAAVDEVTGTIAHAEQRQLWQVRKGYTFFQEGDVLFARITPCMQNGKSAVARNLLSGIGFGTTEFHVMRPKPGLDPSYLHALVRSRSFRRDAEAHFKGTAGQQRVPVSFLMAKVIPVPPISEQRRIVAYLDGLQAKVDHLKALQAQTAAELEALLPAVLEKAFRGEL